jgi:membrane protease YdiL (CAAX protease family)
MRIPRPISRIAALLEVIGVFMAGTLLARAIGRHFAFSSVKALSEPLQPQGVDFLSLAWRVGGDLVLRFGVVLLLAFAVGWWHRRRSVPAYGITLADKPIAWHVRAGALLFATAGLPPRVLIFLSHYFNLGSGPRQWSLHDTLWNWRFWVFMAVSSFVLVPIVEELFARGYIQTRLSEDFGAASAIWITAFFFAFAHTQYFLASPLALGLLISALFGSIVGGYVRYRSGSLLPVMIGHALGNVPMRGVAEAVVILSMLFVALVFRRTVTEYATAMWRELFVGSIVASMIVPLLLLAGTLTLILAFRAYLPLFAVITLGAALVIEAGERRRLPENA